MVMERQFVRFMDSKWTWNVSYCIAFFFCCTCYIITSCNTVELDREMEEEEKNVYCKLCK